MGTGVSRCSLAVEASNCTTMRLSTDLHKAAPWYRKLSHQPCPQLALIWLKGRSIPRQRCLIGTAIHCFKIDVRPCLRL